MIHFPTDVHHDLPTDYKQKFGHQERKRDDLTLKDRQERKRYGCFRRLHAWTRLLAVCVDVVAPGSRSQYTGTWKPWKHWNGSGDSSKNCCANCRATGLGSRCVVWLVHHTVSRV